MTWIVVGFRISARPAERGGLDHGAGGDPRRQHDEQSESHRYPSLWVDTPDGIKALRYHQLS